MKGKLVALLACLLFGMACAPSTPAPITGGGTQPGQTEKKASNQKLRIAQSSLPSTLGPECCVSHRPVFRIMYDMLVTLDDNMQAQPWAAERWEIKDATTFRFFLRKDLTFSNGDKLTADDVEFTVNYFVETKTAPIARFRSIAGARKIDDYTVELYNRAPDASTLPATSYMVILPKKYFQEVGSKEFAGKPIGSGPYVLAEHQPNALQRFTLRPEPHPFRKPQAQEISVLAMPETASVVAGLRTGDLDMAVTVPFLSEHLDVLEREGLQFKTRLTGSDHYVIDQPTWQRTGSPLKELKVRQALNYAVDKETINKRFFRGAGRVSINLVAPGSPFYNEDAKPFAYDPAKAKQLLAEAGYPNGFKLPTGIEYNVNPDLALAVQAYLREIGVDAAVTNVEYGAYVDKFNGRQPTLDIIQVSNIDPDGFNSAVRSYYGCDWTTVPFYCNPEFDRINAMAAAEADPAKRKALMQQANKIITDDVMAIYLVETPSYAVYGKKIQGFEFGRTPYWEYEKAYRIE